MKCLICNKELSMTLYKHLNYSHKTTISNYLDRFPQQRAEHEASKKPCWNKGKTKENDETVASIAKQVKEYCSREEIRTERSQRLYRLYRERGDIVSAEDRARIIRSGSSGWQRKLANATPEERKELLKNFTSAGNLAQEKKRDSLTPADYERLYPWALGKARYHTCDGCNKQHIAWYGGKPRPKKRFCSKECSSNYWASRPESKLRGGSIVYFSSKMNMEFYLYSKLEQAFAQLFDEEPSVQKWSTCPFYIEYEYYGKNCKYFPDFLVNNKYLVETKSDYVRSRDSRWPHKLQAAVEYSNLNGYAFHYIEFSRQNLNGTDVQKIKCDPRVQQLFLG